MGNAKALVWASLAVLSAGCASVPAAVPGPAPNLPDSQRAAVQPEGFISFCMRFSDQCLVHSGDSPKLSLTTQNWQLLNKVNNAVNNAIWPEDDQKHYGRAEYWTIPTDGYGDCDDYAVTKRKDLLAAGIPEPALRLAVVITPTNDRHAVLTVATDKGDFVLDNLTGDIQPWNRTGYTWIERQAAADPMKWVSLLPVYAEQPDHQPTAGSMIETAAVALNAEQGKAAKPATLLAQNGSAAQN